MFHLPRAGCFERPEGPDMELYYPRYLVQARNVHPRSILETTWVPSPKERPRNASPVQEGLFLFRHGHDPYQGSVFSQSPMLLLLWNSLGHHKILFAFVPLLVDALVSILLFRLARKLALKGHQPLVVAGLCVYWSSLPPGDQPAHTNINLTHLAVAAALNHAASGHLLASVLTLGTASALSLYPILLIPSVALLADASLRRSAANLVLQTTAALSLHLGLLAFSLRAYLGSWSFLKSYWSILSVADLTPNVGLSWYFFIEMFDHFRPFFLGVFQLHLATYVAPLCIKLKDDPLLATILLVGLIATFQPYPTLGDIGFFHVLLALYPHLLPLMRYPLVSACVLAYSLALLPVFHYLWLYAGSGNSNFYYAGTLVYGLGNGFLVADVLWAHLKREVGKQLAAKQVDISKTGMVVVQR